MSNKKLNFKDEDPIGLADSIYDRISKTVANKTFEFDDLNDGLFIFSTSFYFFVMFIVDQIVINDFNNNLIKNLMVYDNDKIKEIKNELNQKLSYDLDLIESFSLSLIKYVNGAVSIYDKNKENKYHKSNLDIIKEDKFLRLIYYDLLFYLYEVTQFRFYNSFYDGYEINDISRNLSSMLRDIKPKYNKKVNFNDSNIYSNILDKFIEFSKYASSELDELRKYKEEINDDNQKLSKFKLELIDRIINPLIKEKILNTSHKKIIIETLISKSIINSNEYAANEKIKKNYI